MEDWIKKHSGELMLLFFVIIGIGMLYMCFSAPKELRGGVYLRFDEISDKVDRYRNALKSERQKHVAQLEIYKNELAEVCKSEGIPHRHNGMFGKAVFDERIICACYEREDR